MSFLDFVKRHKIAVIVVSFATIVLVVGFIVLISLLPHDDELNRDDAIKLAIKEYGLDKVLWIDAHASVFSSDPNAELTPSNLRSHYAYYIIIP